MMRDLGDVLELLEFSFESTASPMPPAALWRLARQSLAFNTAMGLTGRLRFDGRRFVQTVEGNAAIVLPLAGAILADPRHGKIRVTAFGAVAARRFHDWQDAGFGERPAAPTGGNLHVLVPPVESRRPSATAAVIGIGASRRLVPNADA
jgi:hypothetical protein